MKGAVDPDNQVVDTQRLLRIELVEMSHHALMDLDDHASPEVLGTNSHGLNLSR